MYDKYFNLRWTFIMSIRVFPFSMQLAIVYFRKPLRLFTGINVIFIRWMMHNLQQRRIMLPDIGMRMNAGREDFIEVDLEAGLKSSNVPVERRYLKFR